MLTPTQQRIVTLRRHAQIYRSNLEGMTDPGTRLIVLARLENTLTEWKELRARIVNEQTNTSATPLTS